MGLLDKTRKKAGIDHKLPEQGSSESANLASVEDKPSVSWLGRTFSERARALSEKIHSAENVNLEEQYAHLENLAKATDLPAPPKATLRERARKFITGFTQPRVSLADKPDKPQRSLRDRARQLIKKIAGGGEEGGAAGAGGTSDASQSASADRGAHLDAEHHQLPEPTFFPWFALTDEGELASQIAFGEEPQSDHHESDLPIEIGADKPSAEQSTLAKFAETVERISENLKNLHVQLDTTSLIRETRKITSTAQENSISSPNSITAAQENLSQRASDSTAPLISHHVSENNQAGATSTPSESARDVFWPKNLPIELPTRDIKFNADGSMSVVPGPFQLPFLAEDIAHPDSSISHFTRNLRNAELFIAEGELQLTRIIYERLLSSIGDEEAKKKIRANLAALQDYKKSHDWGNFMPLPPWTQRNPWADNPPRLNVSEMPVEAKSITINIDKGIFEVARAAFEQEKKLEKDKVAAADDDATDSSLEEEPGEEDQLDDSDGEEQRVAEGDRRKGGVDARGEGAIDRRTGRDRRADEAAGDDTEELAADDAEGDQKGPEGDQRVAEGDRRQGAPDARGEDAPDRRAGDERRDGLEAEPNKPPEPLGADGASPAEEDPADGVLEQPKMPEMAPDGQASSPASGGDEDGGSGEEKEEENKVQEIRGVLELKTPDQEDTPFLTLTYDFTKIPHAYRLAKDNGIFEYAYYKYKPMLVKAHQFIKRKQITRALNYYRVIREQQIPTEFRHMVDRNIKDITEYLQKYLVTRAN